MLFHPLSQILMLSLKTRICIRSRVLILIRIFGTEHILHSIISSGLWPNRLPVDWSAYGEWGSLVTAYRSIAKAPMEE